LGLYSPREDCLRGRRDVKEPTPVCLIKWFKMLEKKRKREKKRIAYFSWCNYCNNGLDVVLAEDLWVLFSLLIFFSVQVLRNEVGLGGRRFLSMWHSYEESLLFKDLWDKSSWLLKGYCCCCCYWIYFDSTLLLLNRSLCECS